MLFLNKKRLFLAVAVSCLSCFSTLEAQFMEAGFTLAGANYRGELADRNRTNEWNRSYGMSLGYHLSPHLVWQTGLLNAQITGHDSNWKKADPRNARNLSFRTDILELTTQIQYSLLKYDLNDLKVSSPYLFLGLGAMYFNPQAQYKGEWYDLQPLGTEGQGSTSGSKKYSRVSMVIPMGFGFRFGLGRRTNLAVEVGWRKTFTDYLDDVSGNYPDLETLRQTNYLASKLSFRAAELTPQPLIEPGKPRGDSKNKDSYLVAGLTLTFNLTDKYGLEWDKKYRIHDDEIAAAKAKKKAKRKREKANLITPPPSPSKKE